MQGSDGRTVGMSGVGRPPESTEQRGPTRVFALTAVAMIVIGVFHLLVQVVIYPSSIYWLSYYVPNYEFGFVRRALGGEILRLLPDEYYFTAAYTFVWLPVLIFGIAVAALMRVILGGRSPSQRRLMLALIVPVLPFAFSYAVYSPRPELLAMTALVSFAILLTKTTSAKQLRLLSGVYGGVLAVLALVHEGIPLQLALGALLALAVLAPGATDVVRRWCALLAVGPGLVVSLAIAAWRRNDVGPLLCERIPHRMVENPYGASDTPAQQLDYMLGRIESKVDYHDWMCEFTTPLIDARLSEGIAHVASFGFWALFASTVVGILYFAGSLGAIQYFSGVRIASFVAALRGRMLLPALGLVMIVPLFVSGVDWTRWWVLITFDVALVYVLFAARQPEIDEPATKKHLRWFVVVALALAILPTGAALHVGGPNF